MFERQLEAKWQRIWLNNNDGVNFLLFLQSSFFLKDSSLPNILDLLVEKTTAWTTGKVFRKTIMK